MIKPDVSGFSNGGLQKMHLALHHAFDKDETTPAGQQKDYGVREFDDWKAWFEAFQKELDRRNITYQKVPW